jgi:hypothetical protein
VDLGAALALTVRSAATTLIEHHQAEQTRRQLQQKARFGQVFQAQVRVIVGKTKS